MRPEFLARMEAVDAARKARVNHSRFGRVDWIGLAIGCALTVGWFFTFNRFEPDYLVDEPGHLGNIYHFLEGKPGWPEQMTMLPGYHFIVAALWQLHPPFKLLTLARLVTTLSALLALVAFALAWRRVHPQPGASASTIGAGLAALLLALLPIFQPFTALAYTDVPAIALVLLAFFAHVAGHRASAALLFALSACIRQTNLIWVGFVVAGEAAHLFLCQPATRRPLDDKMPGRSRAAELWRRTRWLVGVTALGAVAIAAAGRVTMGSQTGTELRPNIATLHVAGAMLLLLGLPLWITALPSAARRWAGAVRTVPRKTIMFTAIAIGAATALSLTFRNPHIWNQALFWDGCTFTLLRNWPLVWIDTHPWLRVVSGINIVLMATALALMFSRQPMRAELWLAFAFGAVLPAANNLVEPRYFIPGAVFILLFLEFDLRTWQRLALWWTFLCALHAPFVATGLSLW